MKKNLFSALLLLWFANSAATLRSLPCANLTTSNDRSQESCFLEPATGVMVTSITPTSISLKWNPVQGAAYFRIKTFDSVGHAMVSNFLIVAKPSNNVATVIDLIPGVNYALSVVPVCANGQESL